MTAGPVTPDRLPDRLTVIVLAAGQGTRMRSELPKVLHETAGRSLLGHVLAAVEPAAPDDVLVVVGHGRDLVTEHLARTAPAARAVVQEEQNGTGHAVRIALETMPRLDGTVVVLPGDAPLLRAETLDALLAEHRSSGATATLLTATVPDPTGYGRVVRDAAGAVTAIVEHRDADEAVRAIAEINAAMYAFDAAALRTALGNLTTDNSQGEEYLTDVIGAFVRGGFPVRAVIARDAADTEGVNDRAQLARAGAALRDRLTDAAMRAGVTIVDPSTTWLDSAVVLEADAVIEPFTRLRGVTVVRAGAVVGPFANLTDTVVDAGATVLSSTSIGARIGEGASVGPYAYLRPGTVIGRRAKVGAYVETKNAVIGDDSKVPHLSYVGDAEIGERSNIGAATIFVNYDGIDKHRSTVGDDVRIGADNMLVAPVRIGDGAYTAAGSVITDDVPHGAMGVARARQRNIDGWVERKRPGTMSAEAAKRARDGGRHGKTDDSTTSDNDPDRQHPQGDAQ
ncbi:MAG: UDP-N-acetylglucosamine pyrophosphorylase [Frankiales bacterium]|nr:UDP-N-acetylglucosamine pyrophosphorylase [Frankiales bacterium]